MFLVRIRIRTEKIWIRIQVISVRFTEKKINKAEFSKS